MAANRTVAELEQISIDDLYPALVQCFGTIICGQVACRAKIGSNLSHFIQLNFRYIAGRLKIISNVDAKGLNTFIGMYYK